jgi:hypothetical protein
MIFNGIECTLVYFSGVTPLSFWPGRRPLLSVMPAGGPCQELLPVVPAGSSTLSNYNMKYYMKTGITSVGTRVEWPEVPHCGVLYCRDFGFFYHILIKELFCIISLYGIYCHLLHIQHSETQLGRNPQKYIFIRCCKLKLIFFWC